MSTLVLIGLIILAIVLVIGIIRVIVLPYDGFINFLMEIMLLDYLGDALGWVFECIGDILDSWD